MTTTVTIDAHCDDKTEVKVTVESANTGETVTLHDGERHVAHVYGDRKLTVMEQSKSSDNTSST